MLPRPAQVSSTETGVIFGNIVYEGTGYAERSVVVLNDIHIDIMDYISPAACADVQFRNMWAEFEWENKVRGGSGCGLHMWPDLHECCCCCCCRLLGPVCVLLCRSKHACHSRHGVRTCAHMCSTDAASHSSPCPPTQPLAGC